MPFRFRWREVRRFPQIDDNSWTTPVQFLFGSTVATASYYGLAPSFDVTVPSVGATAEPISITLGGAKGSQTLYIAAQN